MIAFVNGKFSVKTPSMVVVDVNGIGYEVQISLNTYSQISNADGGKLHTYLHITENAQTLFGFGEPAEKELFLQLISVSGVGASTARMMLSGMRTEEIIKAIVHSETKQLESIKGIGKKTAERIVLELKDKLSKTALLTPLQNQPAVNHEEADAINALTALGINRNAAEAAIKKVMAHGNNLSIESIIKQALKNL